MYWMSLIWWSNNQGMWKSRVWQSVFEWSEFLVLQILHTNTMRVYLAITGSKSGKDWSSGLRARCWMHWKQWKKILTTAIKFKGAKHWWFGFNSLTFLNKTLHAWQKRIIMCTTISLSKDYKLNQLLMFTWKTLCRTGLNVVLHFSASIDCPSSSLKINQPVRLSLNYSHNICNKVLALSDKIPDVLQDIK